MDTFTNFHSLVKQQFWGQPQEVFLPQTNKVTELGQQHIHQQETVGLGAQIAKGALIVGATVCSSFAAFALFGKRVEELSYDAGAMEGHLERRLSSIPEVKATLPPVSVFPTNAMPITVISMSDLFFDPDRQYLVLEVVEKGKKILPSWMTLSTFTYSLGTYNTPGTARGVHVIENLAYVVDGTSGLQIIDVSHPNSPTLKGTYDTPGDAYDVHVVENLAYVADSTSGLQIIDVSNPSSPTLRGNYSTSGYAFGVYVAQNLAYVADLTSGLLIIDVSNPSFPTLKGTYNTPYNTRFVRVAQNLAYVTYTANYYSRLEIIDVGDPSSPIFKGTIDTSGTARSLDIVQNLAYIADSEGGLRIIDVSNSSSPMFRSAYNTPGSSYRVDVVQNFAYVADDSGGLQIIDVSNPRAPILKATYDTTGNAYGVDVVENFAYVADGYSGLTIIEQRFTLSGTPNQTQIGNYEIELIATDPDQNKISQFFRVRVEGPPVASGVFPNQLLNVNAPFTHFINQNVFLDPNNDVIFYASKLANENPLPSWLSFSSIGIFSGTPRSGDVGTYIIKVLAFDGIAPQQAETTFSLSVDHFPEVGTTISDQVADIRNFYNYTIPEETFTDADLGDVLTYQATLSNGNELPSWLSFNALVLSGTPSLTTAGSLSITLSATDQAGAKVQTSFTLNVEHFPDLVNPISNQIASVGKVFTFVIPSNTYTDLDGDTLSYKATRSDGGDLPNWLVFNDLRQEFQGTPLASDKGVLGLKVIAEDPKGGQASTTFNLTIADVLGEEGARIGREFVYAIPNDMIGNPLGPITYTVTLGSGSPLPSWLTFDPLNAIITGTPPSASVGEYTLLITANDFVQPPALGLLNLRVDINAAPEVANFISNQVAQVNQNYRFVVPSNTFIDPNGDSLTLSALRANGRELPKWLKFDASARTLAGQPGPGETGAFSDKALSLQICATDGNEQVCSIFDLSVQGTSNEEQALFIFGPLGSVAAASFAWYKKRGLFVNHFNKSKYDKGTKIVPIEKPFTYALEVEINKVKLVQAFKGKNILAGIPVPKSLDEKGWFEWLKVDKEIHGGHLLPSWLQYDERTNQLRSAFNPRQEDIGLYLVRVYGYGDVILEEIKLDVGGQGSENLEMLELGEGNKNSEMLKPLIEGNDDKNDN